MTSTPPNALGLDMSPPRSASLLIRPVAHQPLISRLKPRISTVAVAALLYRFFKRQVGLPRWIKVITFLLAVPNWRVIPFYWSIWVYIPVFKAWFDILVRRIGQEQRSRYVVGINPLQAQSKTHHVASLDACDFFLHLSNSSYAYALDRARLQWYIKFIGPLLRKDREGVTVLLASTHFTFFQEIPMLMDYQIEVKPVAWDHKWMYLCAVFTTAPPKRSKDRVVNCIGISRVVFKIGRVTIQPERILSLGGFGQDKVNWERGKTLQHSTSSGSKKGAASRSWLVSNEKVACGLEHCELERVNNLGIVKKCLDGSEGADFLKTFVLRRS